MLKRPFTTPTRYTKVLNTSETLYTVAFPSIRGFSKPMEAMDPTLRINIITMVEAMQGRVICHIILNRLQPSTLAA